MGFQRIRRAQARRSASGFTLVELLTVVAIVGVLATIAIVLVRQHFRASKSVEAITIIQAIRAAQESRRAETGSYLHCSESTLWFPAEPDGKTKRSFAVPDGAHADAALWRQLGVSRTDGTQFGFRTYAGPPGAIDVVLDTVNDVPFTESKDHWYVIQAGGDLQPSSSELSLYVASSFNGELYIENEGE